MRHFPLTLEQRGEAEGCRKVCLKPQFHEIINAFEITIFC